MIFIVSWCYGGLAMVVFILFWQGSCPPYTGTTRGSLWPVTSKLHSQRKKTVSEGIGSLLVFGGSWKMWRQGTEKDPGKIREQWRISSEYLRCIRSRCRIWVAYGETRFGIVCARAVSFQSFPSKDKDTLGRAGPVACCAEALDGPNRWMIPATGKFWSVVFATGAVSDVEKYTVLSSPSCFCTHVTFYGVDCLGTYFTHVQTCNVIRVSSATEWTAPVHTLHMPKHVM